MIEIDKVSDYLRSLQQQARSQFEAFESSQGAHFEIDQWSQAIGQGESDILEGGQVFEKAGVNFSHIRGDQLPPAALASHDGNLEGEFSVTGISMVLHPRNPYVPTAHFNLRCFAMQSASDNSGWWFGGGYDLTPYYPFIEDVVAWHEAARSACQPFGQEVYPEFKRWCDEYFFIKHRNETRGVGGLFFDDLKRWEFERSFEFIQAVAQSFLTAYSAIVERRHQTEYSQHERDFQLYRRGRYAEFNLVYDRGTTFGLQSGGRIESILMSLPPKVEWKYDWQPEPGSREEELYKDYLRPRDWLQLESNGQ